MVKHQTWLLLAGCDKVFIRALNVLYRIHYIHSDVLSNFLFMAVAYIRPYVVPYLTPRLCLHKIFLFVSSPSVSIMDWTPSLFDLILTTFPTHSFIEGFPIFRVSTCFHLIFSSKISQTGIRIGVLWKNIQACALWCSMQLICFWFQTIN